MVSNAAATIPELASARKANVFIDRHRIEGMTVSEVKFEFTMRFLSENSESGISPLLRGVPDRIFGRKHGTAI